jgi:hypothetical protein
VIHLTRTVAQTQLTLLFACLLCMAPAGAAAQTGTDSVTAAVVSVQSIRRHFPAGAIAVRWFPADDLTARGRTAAAAAELGAYVGDAGAAECPPSRLLHSCVVSTVAVSFAISRIRFTGDTAEVFLWATVVEHAPVGFLYRVVLTRRDDRWLAISDELLAQS